METAPKSSFDPTKITGFYPLTAAFLLVMESLLGFWLFKAGDSIERIVAGSLMTLIFLGFIYLLYSVKRDEAKKTGEVVIQAKGLGKITPAKEQASESEVRSPEARQISGPDSTYVINKPPDNWITEVLPYEEFIAGNLSIASKNFDASTIASIKENYIGDVLFFNSKNKFSIIPIPGRTLIGKRKIPTALEFTIFPRLSVLSMSRYTPPFYVERSFIHNTMKQVCKIVSTEIFTLKKIYEQVQSAGNRRLIVSELFQEIEDCIVNGKEVKGITNNATLIGIEGETNDYLISLQYPIIAGEKNQELDEDLKMLQVLVSSFRPIEIINQQQKINESKQTAEKEFEEYLSEKANAIFINELAILLFRLQNLDLKDINQISEAIRLMKPFQLFAMNLKIDDEMLNNLWKALDEAEKGHFDDFTDQVNKLLLDFEEGIKKQKMNQEVEKNG